MSERMNLRIEPVKITYHGLHPQGGWKYKRHELEPFFMEANWIEDIVTPQAPIGHMVYGNGDSLRRL